MIPASILLIADDLETGQIWAYTLQKHGFEISLIAPADINEIEQQSESDFDLVMIDVYLMQPVCVNLVKQVLNVTTAPILLLVTDQGERFVLESYEAGVDEVIIKPISFKLLLAKVNAWMRRSSLVPTSELGNYEVGDLRLDPARRQLINPAGAVIKLTGLEFRLLHLLMSHAGQVLESGLIIDRIWGTHGGDTALLKNLVYRLRQKIEPDPSNPRYIQVISREGYTFVASQAKMNH